MNKNHITFCYPADVEYAKAKFAEGAAHLNCAESSCKAILAHFGENPAFSRAASPFGGGIGGQGFICGAVTGSLIASGLILGRSEAADRDISMLSQLAKELTALMRQLFGSEVCSVITRKDEGEEAAEEFKREDGRNTVCAPAVMACTDYTISWIEKKLSNPD